MSHQGTSWQEQLRSAKKNIQGQDEVQSIYPSFIPDFFFKHIQKTNSTALKKQFFANHLELEGGGFQDPIGDAINAIDGGIIHRYENRILFSPTTKCPINCRYCFRKNELNTNSDLFKSSLSKLEQYLENHPEVNEVILTGGDPFFISNTKIFKIFKILNDISTIDFVRFHTRFPIIIPSRFDDELLSSFTKQSFQVLIAIHCNHVDEFTKESEDLIKRLRTYNIQLLSQSVLLKDVNDTLDDLYNLFYKFSKLGIKPYYLHHPDKVKGAMHFYLELEQGRLIYSKIRKKMSGWMIPHYVIDNNSGQGKQLAFNPESIEFSGKFLNLDGQTIDFH